MVFKNLKRREFLYRSLGLMVMGILSGIFPSIMKSSHASKIDRGKLITLYNPQASDGSSGRDNVNLNEDVLREMVDEGVKAFTGMNDLKAAWTEIIPDPRKRVAIKVNCRIEGIYTKAKVVQPIIDGLIQRGVGADNIIIYDKTDTAFKWAGFVKNTGPGVKVGKVTDFGGYHRFLFNRLAKLLTGWFISNDYKCDYLINVPVLKALDGYAGVSLSMKNHYGSIGNPYDHHKDIMTYLSELNDIPYIREKTRLIVLDAIFVEYNWKNGRDQRYVDVLNKIVISNDTVSIDSEGWRMIEKKRKEKGIGSVTPEPVFIKRAVAMGLGTDNPERININLGIQ